MLRLANDDFRNAGAAGIFQRLAQQRIRVLAAFVGCEVVGRLEESIVDLFGFHEVENVDRFVFVQRHGFQIFFRQHDEAALLVFVALDELFPCHRLAFALADALVPHG